MPQKLLAVCRYSESASAEAEKFYRLEGRLPIVLSAESPQATTSESQKPGQGLASLAAVREIPQP